MIELPDLPYAYDALAPTISEATLRTHHLKHHARYVEVANALAAEAGLAGLPLDELVRKAHAAGSAKLFNNAAQAWNHAFFWRSMSPRPGAMGLGVQLAAPSVGGPAGLRRTFLDAGAAHFGSGWVWLLAEAGALKVVTTHDAGTPLIGGATPLLVCDLWEHAYYLDYRNDRAAFLAAWWDRLVNWSFAEAQLP